MTTIISSSSSAWNKTNTASTLETSWKIHEQLNQECKDFTTKALALRDKILPELCMSIKNKLIECIVPFHAYIITSHHVTLFQKQMKACSITNCGNLLSEIHISIKDKRRLKQVLQKEYECFSRIHKRLLNIFNSIQPQHSLEGFYRKVKFVSLEGTEVIRLSFIIDVLTENKLPKMELESKLQLGRFMYEYTDGAYSGHVAILSEEEKDGQKKVIWIRAYKKAQLLTLIRGSYEFLEENKHLVEKIIVEEELKEIFIKDLSKIITRYVVEDNIWNPTYPL